MKCCVPNCGEELKSNISERNGITFHKLPKDPYLRNLLLEALRLKIKPDSRTVLCSRHFDSGKTVKKKRPTVKKNALVTHEENCEEQSEEYAEANLKICRMCLCTDRRVYNIEDNGIAQQYEFLTASKVCLGDGLPQHICWECKARLASFTRLRSVALQSLELLQMLNDSMVGDQGDNVQFIIDRDSNNLTSALGFRGLEVAHYPPEGGWIDVLANTNDNNIAPQIENISDNYQSCNLNVHNLNRMAQKNINDNNQSSNLRMDYDNIGTILENENDNIVSAQQVKRRERRKNKLKTVNECANRMNMEKENDNNINISSHLVKKGRGKKKSLENPNDNINSLGLENVNDNSDKVDVNDNSNDGCDIFDEADDNYLEEDTDNIDNSNIENTNHYDSFEDSDLEDLSEISEIESVNLENDYKSELDDIINDFDSSPSDEEIATNIDSDLAKIDQVFNNKKLEMITLNLNVKYNYNDNYLEDVEPKRAMEKYFTITELSRDEQLKQLERKKETDNYIDAGFKCDECYRGFLYEYSFKKHQLKHTEANGTHKCPVCRINFKTMRNRRKHILWAHAYKYSCKERGCDFVSHTHLSANSHKRLHEGKVFECPQCDKKFAIQTTYFGHLRIAHPSDIVCRLCGYSFVSDFGLNLHIKRMHGQQNLEVPEDGPQCLKCNIQFSNDSALITHYHKSNKHKDCRPYIMRDPNAMKRVHVPNKRSEGRITKCEQCDEQFRGYRSYYRHYRMRHPDKNPLIEGKYRPMYMCETCGKFFGSPYTLKEHSNTHMENIAFVCRECGKKCGSKVALSAHELLHLNVKHVCDMCGKSFSTGANLIRHQIIHQGLHFDCETCGKRFSHPQNLQSHTKYVHQKVPWPKKKKINNKGEKVKNGQASIESQSSLQPQELVEEEPINHEF